MAVERNEWSAEAFKLINTNQDWLNNKKKMTCIHKLFISKLYGELLYP